MWKVFLRIRLRQAWHYVTELGWLRLLLVVPFVLFFIGSIGQSLWQERGINSVYVAILVSMSLLSLHLNRADKWFVKQLNISSYFLFLVEYLFLSSPLLFLFAGSQQWLALGILLLVSLLLPLLKIQFTFRSFRGLRGGFRFIPATMFEWRSGLRRHIWWLFPLWLLGIIGNFYYVWLVPLVLFVIAYHTCSYHLESESQFMLRAYQLPAKALVHLKIREHLKLYWLICLLPCLVFLFQYPQWWYIIVYFGISSSILQIFSIVYKYSLYKPSTPLPYNYILISFLGLSIINPMLLFLLPVLLIMTYKHYIFVTKNISLYL